MVQQTPISCFKGGLELTVWSTGHVIFCANAQGLWQGHKPFFALLMFQVCHGALAFELTVVVPCNLLRKYARMIWLANMPFVSVKIYRYVQICPKIQICPLWVLKFSAMCKSALRKKFDLIFWAQILVFQKFSFSHIWRTQKAIRICKKKSLKNLANLPFLRVSAEIGVVKLSENFCIDLHQMHQISVVTINGE